MSVKNDESSFLRSYAASRHTSLPEGEDWAYELKLDGYRAIAFKSNGRVQLRSRNNEEVN
jgi:ATP-dependent DNA ligase